MSLAPEATRSSAGGRSGLSGIGVGGDRTSRGTAANGAWVSAHLGEAARFRSDRILAPYGDSAPSSVSTQSMLRALVVCVVLAGHLGLAGCRARSSSGDAGADAGVDAGPRVRPGRARGPLRPADAIGAKLVIAVNDHAESCTAHRIAEILQDAGYTACPGCSTDIWCDVTLHVDRDLDRPERLELVPFTMIPQRSFRPATVVALSTPTDPELETLVADVVQAPEFRAFAAALADGHASRVHVGPLAEERRRVCAIEEEHRSRGRRERDTGLAKSRTDKR